MATLGDTSWADWPTQAAATGGRKRLKHWIATALRDLVSRFTAGDLHDLAEFIQGVASFDLDFSLECLQMAVPSLQGGFAADAFKAYRAASDLQLIVLGHGIFGDGAHQSYRRTSHGRSPTLFAQQIPRREIETCRLGDWETTLGC